MSFPRYSEYKDSGVEWLGDVPEHWERNQGRRLFTQEREPARPTDDQLSATQKYGVVPQKLFMEMEGQKVTLALSGLDNFKHVEEGDFVISLRSFQGGIERSAYSGCVSPAYTVLRPAQRIDGQFWSYLLKSKGYIEALQTMTDGIRDGKTISYQQFGQLVVPVIPLPEQAAIAAFLERETAKIDELVAEQRRLIELMKEKRQAVISHAVTKGLNHDAPMTPSGIEWLGQIPTHWQLKRLKHVTIPGRGIQMGPFGGMLKDLEQSPTIFKLYGQENTINDDFSAGSRWLSTEHFDSLREYELRPGDVVLTRKGASIGNCRVVPYGIQPGVIDSDTIRVRLDSDVIIVAFAVLLMHEGYMEAAILEEQKGAVLPGLNSRTIANLQIAMPPMEEQFSILEFLTEQLIKFDALTAEAQRAIDLLQERRTALISAAVTGKIDVREFSR